MERQPIKEVIKRFQWDFEGRKLRMGIGCAYFGGSGDYRDRLKDDLEVMMRSYEMGFRYYDTSRSYGNSEQAVGEFIARIPRESIFLATKSRFPFRTDPENAFQHFKDNFYQSFERLQTDHINLFQIHDTEHLDCCLHEVIPFLIERRDEGLIDYIGMGTRSLNALELGVVGGYLDSVLSYINYSLLTRAADHMIDVCGNHGAAFINASVLHFGAFKGTLGEREKQAPYQRRDHERAMEMNALCKEMGIDAIQASLQYSLFNPGIDMTLNGINRMSNLDSTANAMRAVIYPDQWMRIAELMEQNPYLYIQDNLM